MYEIDLVEVLESAYPLDLAAVRCSCISCSFTMYLNLKFQNIHEILYLVFLQVIFCKNAGVLACACQEINTLSH